MHIKFKKAIVDKRLKTPDMIWKTSESQCTIKEEVVTRVCILCCTPIISGHCLFPIKVGAPQPVAFGHVVLLIQMTCCLIVTIIFPLFTTWPMWQPSLVREARIEPSFLHAQLIQFLFVMKNSCSFHVTNFLMGPSYCVLMHFIQYMI